MSKVVLLGLFFSMLTGKVYAESSIGDSLKNGYGDSYYTTLGNAMNNCFALSKSLPTIRQYAELATQLGAKGIRETKFPNQDYVNPSKELDAEINQNLSDGFVLIPSDNGKIDSIEFYYNSTGYVPPKGDHGLYRFWTAPEQHSTEIGRVFDGKKGIIVDGISGWEGRAAVRCAN